MVILERVTDFTTNSTNFNQRIGSPKRSHFGALKTGNIGLKYVEALNFVDKNWLLATTLTLYPADPSHPTSVVTYQTP